jgi:hypothetical protein
MSVTAILVLYRARKPAASGRSPELARKLPNFVYPAFRRPTADFGGVCSVVHKAFSAPIESERKRL